MSKLTYGDHVIIIGGKYRGSTGVFHDETAFRYRIKVEGKVKPCYLSKENVIPEKSQHPDGVKSLNPPQEPKLQLISLMEAKCTALAQEISAAKNKIVIAEQSLDEIKDLLQQLKINPY
jgi:ribosomal protein L24